jgi:hypothetical protein
LNYLVGMPLAKQYRLILVSGLILLVFLFIMGQRRDYFNAASKKSVQCPIGSFCPPGAPNNYPCPAGFFGSSTGLREVQCTGVCNAGRVCDPGATSADGQKACPAGYYCLAGTGSLGPVQPIICPEGHYCPEGAKLPTVCPDGVYCPKGTSAI